MLFCFLKNGLLTQISIEDASLCMFQYFYEKKNEEFSSIFYQAI